MNKRKNEQEIHIKDPELQVNLLYLLCRVCEITKIAITKIRGDFHTREITDVRHAFAFMAKQTYPELTDWEIASILNVDRTTVIYYLKEVNMVREKKKVYLKLREDILDDEN